MRPRREGRRTDHQKQRGAEQLRCKLDVSEDADNNLDDLAAGPCTIEFRTPCDD